MKTGIVGSCDIGGALTSRFRAAGHDVVVDGDHGPASRAKLVKETGARRVCVGDDERGEGLSSSRSCSRRRAILSSICPPGVADDPIAIAVTNYYPQQGDGRMAEIGDGIVKAVWVDQDFGYSVIETYNTIIEPHLQCSGTAAGPLGLIALAIVGDRQRKGEGFAAYGCDRVRCH